MQENKLTQFVTSHFWTLALTVCSLLFMGISLDRYLASKKIAKKQDFITARTLLLKYSKGEPFAQEALDTLTAILKRHPELHADYDKHLTLSFLQQENPSKAIEVAQAIGERKIAHTPEAFAEFSRVALLLAKDKYGEALIESQKLEELLSQDPSLPILRAFNLVRIAFLAKKLDQHELHKTAWSTLQGLESFPKVEALFQEGSFTLKDYLQA